VTDIMTNRSLVEQELRKIYEERDQLVPAEIVDIAAGQDHPLHQYFEWDNTAAGRAYRNMQATQMVRSVTITVTKELDDGKIEDRHVRAWVPARYVGEPRPGYMPTEAVQSPEQRALLQRQVKREITALYRKYGDTAEFWDVVDALSRPAAISPAAPAGSAS
jgi:hypothetical protein